MWQPWCTLDCSTVTDPMECCMDCAPVDFHAMKMLQPGESIAIHWDGTLYGDGDEVCGCGCYRRFPAPAGEYRASIFGSPDFVCRTGFECVPDENGIINGAGTSDILMYYEARFHVPEASGETITLVN